MRGMGSEAKPWLSLVLPVHNGEQWVGAALESIAIQTDPGLEVIVIDTSDGPGTRAIVESYAEVLNLRIVDAAGAEGCLAKTNRGVAEARADHVSWLCQDDLWLPGRTAAVRHWIDEAPEAL
jgi:glycosyltransferase involved in cell wall biosynthesis